MLPYFQYFTPERIAEVMHNFKYILFWCAPIFMIGFAIDGVGILIRIVRKAFDHDDEDDDDYEMRSY